MTGEQAGGEPEAPGFLVEGAPSIDRLRSVITPRSLPFDRSEIANIVDLSSSVGKELFLYVGELGFRELQLSYLLASLKKMCYQDYLDVRIRRHVLLYWVRGFFKTSILRSFVRDAISGVEIVDQSDYNNNVPSFLWTGHFSKARLRGSVEATRLGLPLIQRPRFLLSSEMTDFLSGTEDMEEMMNFMNGILEEGEGRVSLMKMVGIEPSEVIATELARRDIGFNSAEGLMSFKVQGVSWFATRPMESGPIRKLEMSGFLDRFNMARWHYNMREFLQMCDWLPPAQAREMPKLNAMNRFIWDTKFHNVNAPPRQMVLDVKSALSARYTEKEAELGIQPDGGLRSARDNTNIMQLITAFAVADTISQRPDNQDGSFERIRYGPEAGQKILDYLPHYVDSRTKYRPGRSGLNYGE